MPFRRRVSFSIWEHICCPGGALSGEYQSLGCVRVSSVTRPASVDWYKVPKHHHMSYLQKPRKTTKNEKITLQNRKQIKQNQSHQKHWIKSPRFGAWQGDGRHRNIWFFHQQAGRIKSLQVDNKKVTKPGWEANFSFWSRVTDWDRETKMRQWPTSAARLLIFGWRQSHIQSASQVR